APRASGAAAADVCAGAREPARDRLDARIHSDAVVSRAPDADAAARRARAVHRLDVLLRRVGAEGALPGDPRAPAVRRGGARTVRQRAAAARSDRPRAVAD